MQFWGCIIMKRKKYQEIWIDKEKGQLCVLINGDLGWLMYMEEEINLISENPEYLDREEEIEFILENGQRDYYPIKWCYSIKEIEKAIEYFEKNNELPSFIKWCEE